MTTKSITDKIIEIRKYKKLSQKDFACKTLIIFHSLLLIGKGDRAKMAEKFSQKQTAYLF